MKSLVTALLLGLASATQYKCSVKDDMKIAFTPCSPDGLSTAYPYYDKNCKPQQVTDSSTGDISTHGSERLPSPFRQYDCSQMVCPQDGMYRTVDFSSLQPRQECKRCPKNSVALRNGLQIDAKMEDEKHLSSKLAKHFKFSCEIKGFDSAGNPVSQESQKDGEDGAQPATQEMKALECLGWRAGSRSLKTTQRKIENEELSKISMVDYTAEVSRMTFKDVFLEPGNVRFKFRVFSAFSGDHLSGQFSFMFDGKEIDLLYDVKEAGLWQERTYKIEAPGVHQLEWSFTRIDKISSRREDMVAEIQFIRIDGITTSPTACRRCNKGVANEQQDKCEECPQNTYLDDLESSGGECLKCPDNTYSLSGSVGSSSCKPKRPCQEWDYTMASTKCNPSKDAYTKRYKWWNQGEMCDIYKGVHLPDNKEVHCRGSGRGQYRNEDGQLEFCSPGTYQEVDNYDRPNAKKITSCEYCPPGSEAPQVLDYTHFDFWPDQLNPLCIEATHLGKAEECQLIQGWHVNEKGLIDSGEGLPVGLKYLIRTPIEINSHAVASLTLEFKLSGLAENELLRISMNNQMLEEYRKETIDFITFEKENLGTGSYTLDISIVSDFKVAPASGFQSKARAQIKELTLKNAGIGGGVSCTACPAGKMSTGKTSNCERCPPGYYPNSAQTLCEACPAGHFKPETDGVCTKCPEFTKPNAGRTACEPVDVITTQLNKRLFKLSLHKLLRFDLFCSEEENYHACEGRTNQVGPVLSKKDDGLVSFFANGRPLETDHYEFHKTQMPWTDSSYIYMLHQPGDISIEQIAAIHGKKIQRNSAAQGPKYGEGYTDVDKESFGIYRELFSMGSTVEAIENVSINGFKVQYGQGDYCDPHNFTRRFSSEIEFKCSIDFEGLFKARTENINAYLGIPTEDLRGASFSTIERPEEESTKTLERPYLKEYDASSCKAYYIWETKWACGHCREDQLTKVEGRCQAQMNNLTMQAVLMKLTSPDAGKGIRTIAKLPKSSEKCLVFPEEQVKKDGTSIKQEVQMNEEQPMFKGLSENLQNDILREEFASGRFTTEDCDLQEEVPEFIKQVALAISCLLAMLCVCGCLICCSYCQMEQQYDQLEMSVRENARQAGLPDDYDFNEDNVYMQELRREEELRYGVVQRAEADEDAHATKRRAAVEEEETGHI